MKIADCVGAVRRRLAGRGAMQTFAPVVEQREPRLGPMRSPSSAKSSAMRANA